MVLKSNTISGTLNSGNFKAYEIPNVKLKNNLPTEISYGEQIEIKWETDGIVTAAGKPQLYEFKKDSLGILIKQNITNDEKVWEHYVISNTKPRGSFWLKPELGVEKYEISVGNEAGKSTVKSEFVVYYPLKIANYNVQHNHRCRLIYESVGFFGYSEYECWRSWQERIDASIDEIFAVEFPDVIGLTEVAGASNGHQPNACNPDTTQNEQINRFFDRLKQKVDEAGLNDKIDYHIAWFTREGDSMHEGARGWFPGWACYERKYNSLIYNRKKLTTTSATTRNCVNETLDTSPPDNLNLYTADFCFNVEDDAVITGAVLEIANTSIKIPIYNLHLHMDEQKYSNYIVKATIDYKENLYDDALTIPPIIIGDYNAGIQVTDEKFTKALENFTEYQNINPLQPFTFNWDGIEQIRVGEAGLLDPITNAGYFLNLDWWIEYSNLWYSSGVRGPELMLHSDHPITMLKVGIVLTRTE